MICALELKFFYGKKEEREEPQPKESCLPVESSGTIHVEWFSSKETAPVATGFFPPKKQKGEKNEHGKLGEKRGLFVLSLLALLRLQRPLLL